jgi:hypothetical protein
LKQICLWPWAEGQVGGAGAVGVGGGAAGEGGVERPAAVLLLAATPALMQALTARVSVRQEVIGRGRACGYLADSALVAVPGAA